MVRRGSAATSPVGEAETEASAAVRVTLELGARHPGAAGGLIVGAACPDIEAGGLREAHRALLGSDDTGVPDPSQLDAHP